MIETKKEKLLGYEIDCLNTSQAVEYACQLIKTRKGGQVITINPEMIQEAKKNEAFSNVVKNADLILPDGVGIEIAFKIKNKKVDRVPGIDFSMKMLEQCAKDKIPVALVGAKPHVISGAVKRLKDKLPDLKIVYYHNGYFSDDERIIKELKRNVPKFVLVALGSPKQEFFIEKARRELPAALMIGVGGSFDVWSGNVKRAPEFFQKTGLEWLYRTIKEPNRFKRIFPTLPKFIIRVIIEDK
ncbi:MAG: glycosyltransferase [Candidatus Melainabacteria bacterium]|nr:MAG: glycosyltransferase [Candidatus Melainabacteria bacterium]